MSRPHCWPARFGTGPCDYTPRGKPDPTHTIPQRRIKDVLERRGFTPEQIEAALNDPRIIEDGCRRHHDQLDRKLIRLRRADYPASTHEWADEYGFDYDEERCEWYGLAAPERKAHERHHPDTTQ